MDKAMTDVSAAYAVVLAAFLHALVDCHVAHKRSRCVSRQVVVYAVAPRSVACAPSLEGSTRDAHVGREGGRVGACRDKAQQLAVAGHCLQDCGFEIEEKVSELRSDFYSDITQMYRFPRVISATLKASVVVNGAPDARCNACSSSTAGKLRQLMLLLLLPHMPNPRCSHLCLLLLTWHRL
jgi:hypothetical protein